MRLHKEGWMIILFTVLFIAVVLFTVNYLIPLLMPIFLIAAVLLLAFVLQFFRHPARTIEQLDDSIIYSPADGKVVVMEEKIEEEFFGENRLMLSIFMSPLDVHCNRVPFSGEIEYVQHHAGSYLVAWHPKSSTENERTSTVLKGKKTSILIRQIAGAVARRIRTYVKPGDQVKQGEELGFIKFGSRVDIFLPTDAEVKVKIGQQVRANIDVLAVLD